MTIEPTKADMLKRAADLQIWKKQLFGHLDLCYEYFPEKRADIIVEQAKILKDRSTAGAIQTLDICMQIEEEFPGRIEEFVTEAQRHPQGPLIGLSQYIRYQRNRG